MPEYTFGNLIINPEDSSLEGLMGKEVYFGDMPITCIHNANGNHEVGILRGIQEDTYCPFCVETPNRGRMYYACIIPKKEEPEPEYVPFESVEEFMERYTEVRKKAELGSLNDNFFQCGMWLKEKGQAYDVYCMVTEIWKYGVDVGSNRITTEENTVLSDFTLWRDLYLGYTFLDGSPCGKLRETK